VIDGIPVLQVGAGGLVTLFVVAILVGRLVPRRTLDDISHDRDEWRTAHRISETARVEQSAQLTELLEHARTTDAVLRSLPRPKDAP
jgi:hypothetical protein